MQKLRSRKALAGMLAAAVVIGGGVAALTPAGAVVADSAATNWKKVWKKELKPLADKRYYTKKQSNAKYSTKTETSTLLGNYYTKAMSDAAYALKGSSYTKAESDANYYTKTQSDANYYAKATSDAKYAPAPAVIRGTWVVRDVAAAGGDSAGADFSYGVLFAAAPAVHIIPIAGVPPAGCSGTADVPSAQVGHLCVFESAAFNSSVDGVFNLNGGTGSSRMGAYVSVSATAGGLYRHLGSWAVGVGAPGTYSVTAAAQGLSGLGGSSGPADDLP